MAQTLRASRMRPLVLVIAGVFVLLLVAVGCAGATDLWDRTVTSSTPQSQFQLYEGTAQIQRLVIARETLLPRRVEEPAAAAV